MSNFWIGDRVRCLKNIVGAGSPDDSNRLLKVGEIVTICGFQHKEILFKVRNPDYPTEHDFGEHFLPMEDVELVEKDILEEILGF